MENKNEQAGFAYTYSAREQEEIKAIRDKYGKREESKMERLRRLDNSVTKKAQAVALTLGVVGTLILGFGMSLIMSELAKHIGIQGDTTMPLGIMIGLIGGAVGALAYPVYNFTLKRERQKIAPEILKLTDELIKK